MKKKLTMFGQDWKVRIEKHRKLEGAVAINDPDLGAIFIEPNLNNKEQKSVLLHEILHVIEYYFGFDLGKQGDMETVELIEKSLIEIIRENDLDFR